MKEPLCINDYRNQTPAGLLNCIENLPVIMTDHGDIGYINITSELTFLIQQTGRFAEKNAAQLLDCLAPVRSLCDTAYPFSKYEPAFDAVYLFGIHRNGVDGNDAVCQKLYKRYMKDDNDTIDTLYNHVYAVHIKISYTDETGYIWNNPSIYISIHDISALPISSCDWCIPDTEQEVQP